VRPATETAIGPRGLTLYPDDPAVRARAIGRDLAVLVCVLGFAWLALRVYHDLDRLSALGTGVRQAGAGITSGFGAAASATRDVPLVGGPLAGALRSAGSSAGGNLAALGFSEQQSAHHVARLIGVLTWLLPTALLLLVTLPGRIAQVRRLTAARRALAGPHHRERERLIALRALLSLPDDTLLAHTADPAGDLLASRYDGLVAAAYDDLGLRPARPGS
jgi:hypothetical protein